MSATIEYSQIDDTKSDSRPEILVFYMFIYACMTTFFIFEFIFLLLTNEVKNRCTSEPFISLPKYVSTFAICSIIFIYMTSVSVFCSQWRIISVQRASIIIKLHNIFSAITFPVGICLLIATECPIYVINQWPNITIAYVTQKATQIFAGLLIDYLAKNIN
uniref:Uncharacterized protein n=1 Tax=viral metagenome TaxID=1070528 RepID=A0A6C0C8S1_9ZZZZ